VQQRGRCRQAVGLHWLRRLLLLLLRLRGVWRRGRRRRVVSVHWLRRLLVLLLVRPG